MNLKKINGYLVGYQRQGNDKNGNPIYIINIFHDYKSPVLIDQEEVIYSNYNYTLNQQNKVRLDKYGNIKVTSYNINDSINQLLSAIKN